MIDTGRTKRPYKRAATWLAGLGAGALVVAPAWAVLKAEIDFTANGGDPVEFSVQNQSATLVTSVVVRQLADNGCSYVEKRAGANLDSISTDWVKVRGDAKCTYRATFKTANGCTGEKVGRMTPKRFREGKRNIALKNGCGSLAVKFQDQRQY